LKPVPLSGICAPAYSIFKDQQAQPWKKALENGTIFISGRLERQHSATLRMGDPSATKKSIERPFLARRTIDRDSASGVLRWQLGG
jgi:hypothetical protein